MVTRDRPTKYRVGRSEREEFYVPPGDPIGVRHWCAAGVMMFFGIEIEAGEQVEIEVSVPFRPASGLHEDTGKRT